MPGSLTPSLIPVHHLRNICLTRLGIWRSGDWNRSTTMSFVGELGMSVGGMVTELRHAGGSYDLGTNGMMESHDDAKWVGGGLCGNHQGTGAGWMKDDGEAGRG